MYLPVTITEERGYLCLLVTRSSLLVDLQGKGKALWLSLLGRRSLRLEEMNLFFAEQNIVLLIGLLLRPMVANRTLPGRRCRGRQRERLKLWEGEKWMPPLLAMDNALRRRRWVTPLGTSCGLIARGLLFRSFSTTVALALRLRLAVVRELQYL